MMKMADGWYAKFGEIYRGEVGPIPFSSPWEVFENYPLAGRAAFLKKGKELLLVESKIVLKLPEI